MVDRFDKKLSSFLDSSSSTSVQSSYASVASSTALTNSVPSSTMSVQKNITPHSLSPDALSAFLISAVRHGYMPSCIRDSVMSPLLKGNKNPLCSDSFRPIALASCISKVLEILICTLFSRAVIFSLVLNLALQLLFALVL